MLWQCIARLTSSFHEVKMLIYFKTFSLPAACCGQSSKHLLFVLQRFSWSNSSVADFGMKAFKIIRKSSKFLFVSQRMPRKHHLNHLISEFRIALAVCSLSLFLCNKNLLQNFWEMRIYSTAVTACIFYLQKVFSVNLALFVAKRQVWNVCVWEQLSKNFLLKTANLWFRSH
jgi:hypothetical protein